MLKGSPLPRLHAKAAETKNLLEPTAWLLEEVRPLDESKADLLNAMAAVIKDSHAIDTLVDSMNDFAVPAWQGEQLERLVLSMNVGITKLCHHFHKQATYLFNFVPKNHYLFHLAQLGKHMSPKLAWCYQGEDLMHHIKVLAVGSFRGTLSRRLGNKILAKYLMGLAQELSP